MSFFVFLLKCLLPLSCPKNKNVLMSVSVLFGFWRIPRYLKEYIRYTIVGKRLSYRSFIFHDSHLAANTHKKMVKA